MGNMFGSAPKVETGAVEDLEEGKDKSKNVRSALLATEGGILGEEVQDVKKRETLLGN